MLHNYFKIAWRNLLGYKAFSLLNSVGLAIGMVVSLLIGFWVLDEVSYDRFHANAPQLFRLTATVNNMDAAITSGRMAPALVTQLPVVKAAVRLKNTQELVSIGGQIFKEEQVYFTDPSLLTMFSFELVQGSPKTALTQPNGAVITQKTALKYFHTVNALGKTIRILKSTAQGNAWREVIVTGVLQNVPSQSHLQFDLLLPFSSYVGTEQYAKNDAWDAFSLFTYLQLDERVLASKSHHVVEQQINQLYQRQQSLAAVTFHLQPLTDIHLRSSIRMIQDVEGHGSIQYVRTFAVIALIVLLIACINFMNLSTARSARRAKEVGLRKVIGATKGQLIGQFLGEAFMLSLLAVLIASALLFVILPMFNQLTGKMLTVNLLTPVLLISLGALTIITSLIAGSYPALLLSSFRPVQVLTGTLVKGQHAGFRDSLVVIQFIVSVVLLIGTLVIYGQLRLIRDHNSGFDKENLLYVAIPRWGDLYKNTQALKATLLQYPETSNYSVISDLPVNLQTGKSNFDWPGKDPANQVLIPYAMVDAKFIQTFRVKLLAGRNFSADSEADQANYLVNETALPLMKLNLKTAIGTRLSFGDNTGQIIGVVKDFNFKPLQSGVEPLVLRYNRFGGYVVVRVQPRTLTETKDRLQGLFKKLYPDHPFSYSFVDEDVAKLYRSEQRMGSLFNAFAFFSILISCLGLFGLSTFTAEQRTKEIGIRKVLGASVYSIVALLSKAFLKLVVIAILIASPIAWWVMHHWLQGFAYRVNIEWWVIVAAGLLAVSIALLTIGYQSVKTALMNPSRSLRSD